MSLESGYTARLIIHRPSGDVDVEFETWQNGGIDSDETKHRDPVTRALTARGGLRTRENVTLTRECDAQAWALVPTLEDSAGIDPCTAIRQMVGPRGEAIGEPFTLTGVLKAPKYPDYDLSGNNVGMLSIEVSTNEKRA